MTKRLVKNNQSADVEGSIDFESVVDAPIKKPHYIIYKESLVIKLKGNIANVVQEVKSDL